MTLRSIRFWLMVVLGCAALHAGMASAGTWRELRASQARPDRMDRDAGRQNAGRPERPERPQRSQRLSDEERRELHRDLDKARREIYRPHRER